MPSRKPPVSATWASTLLPITTSARNPSATRSRARSRVKNAQRVRIPAAAAAPAGPGAGSMPRTGIPRSTKVRSRYPSLLASSTTRLPAPRRRASMSSSALARAWARIVSENEE